MFYSIVRQGSALTYIEDHKNDADDLFLVEVVEDLADALDYGKLVVTELLHGEGVVGQDPKGAAHVVGNLAILEAVILEEALHEVKAFPVDEISGELVGLHHVHDAVRESDLR